MNLIEVLTGSVVFAASAGSSLQLWGLAAAAAVAEQLLIALVAAEDGVR